MKVYLDDTRQPPEGWTLVAWPDEAIAYLKTNTVTHLSLDHDLGNDEKGTGYTVLQWIEEQVVTNNFYPPIIYIHTANPAARKKMELALASIQRRTLKIP